MFSYSFSNLIGYPYKGGTLTFTPDTSSGRRADSGHEARDATITPHDTCDSSVSSDLVGHLVFPVSNRVNVHDLLNGESYCLPPQNLNDVAVVCISPDSSLLLSFDVRGTCQIIALDTGILLHQIHFKDRVHAASFSDDGRCVGVCSGQRGMVWRAPCYETNWQMSLVRDVRHNGRVVGIDFAPGGRFIVTASSDGTARLESVVRIKGMSPTHFVAHRCAVVGAFFSKCMYFVYTVGEDGSVITWKWHGKIKKEEEQVMKDEEAKDKAEEVKDDEEEVDDEEDEEDDEEDEEEEETEEEDEVKDEDMNDEAVKNEDVKGEESSVPHGGKRNTFSGKSGRLSYGTGEWQMEKKGFCGKPGTPSRLTQAVYHRGESLLLLGLDIGVFSIYSLPDYSALHSLSLGVAADQLGAGSRITSLAFNPSGEWIGVGCADLGQVLVWEWKSETSILKQQGHHFGIRSVAFSPGGSVAPLGSRDAGSGGGADSGVGLGGGSIIATGGYDGKVKVWSSQTGFSFVTFTEHSAAITGLAFTPQVNAVVSSSLDGSVRAFDLMRYRNFRTFAAPPNSEGAVEFSCVAVDPGGEIVVAGGQGGGHLVYVWSIQTGRLLERLSGHEGPVVSVAFHPHVSKGGVLCSAAWDGTIRVWNLFSKAGSGTEVLGVPGGDRMILAIAMDPRGNGLLAASGLSGVITFWDIDNAEVVGSVDGLRDIGTGRNPTDKFAVVSRGKHKGADKRGQKGIQQNQHFSSIDYSPNGSWLICGSRNSPKVCVYSTDRYVLVHMFRLTHNRSIHGVERILNARHMTEAGVAIEEFDLSGSEHDLVVEDSAARKRRRRMQESSMPGVTVGEAAHELAGRELHVWCISCSADGRHWAAATSHGVFLYSIDFKGGQHSSTCGSSAARQGIGPVSRMLTQQVTVPRTLRLLKKGNYSKALSYALSMNEMSIIRRTYEQIPLDSIPLVAGGLSPLLLPNFLNFLRVQLNLSPTIGTPHLHIHLAWVLSVLSTHLHDFSSEERRVAQSADQLDLHIGDMQQLTNLRGLFLMLLRQIEQTQNSLKQMYAPNVGKLKFLAAAAKRTAALESGRGELVRNSVRDIRESRMR